MYVVRDVDHVAACQQQAEPCEVCHKAVRRARGGVEVPLLECAQCLRGYHLACLDPPLDSVPQVSFAKLAPA